SWLRLWSGKVIHIPVRRLKRLPHETLSPARILRRKWTNIRGGPRASADRRRQCHECQEASRFHKWLRSHDKGDVFGRSQRAIVRHTQEDILTRRFERRSSLPLVAWRDWRRSPPGGPRRICAVARILPRGELRWIEGDFAGAAILDPDEAQTCRRVGNCATAEILHDPNTRLAIIRGDRGQRDRFTHLHAELMFAVNFEDGCYIAGK